MKKLKKILAMALAMAMVLGMSVTVLADGSDPTKTTISGEPSNQNKVSVKITGLETDKDDKVNGSVNVTLYQIADAEYDATDGVGFIRYNWTDLVTGTGTSYVADTEVEFPEGTTLATSDITKIANHLSGKIPHAGPTKVENGVYIQEVPAGVYIAIISNSTSGYVYNPVLLTASYSAEDKADTFLIGGTINAATAKYLNGSTAVVKREEPGIEKKITNNRVNDDGTAATGDNGKVTGSVGDEIRYEITPTLPSYPADASNKTFFISDSMDPGLTFDYGSLEISLGNGVVVNKKYTTKDGNLIRQYYYGIDTVFAESVKTTSDDQEDGFNINFNYENLISDKGTGATYTPIITYRAIINENAVAGSAGNKNDVKMIYSKTPNTGTDWDTPVTPPTPKPSSGEEYGDKTDRETVYTFQLAFLKTDDTATNPKHLPGAIFGIYKTGSVADKTVSGLIDTVTTNEAGYAVSSKVGAGTYYIKEIKAPDGYSLSDAVTEIQANWNSATTTTVTATTQTHYTSEQPDGVPQVGWLVGEGDNAVFHKIGEYEARTADGVETIYSMPANTPALNVRRAYLESTQTTSTMTAETVINKGNTPGTGLVLGANITNTKLTALPSTGGIGTTIFTIGGCAIMIIAAGLYFATRRKKEI